MEAGAVFEHVDECLFTYHDDGDSMVKWCQQHHVELRDQIAVRHPKFFGIEERPELAKVSVVLSSFNQRETLELALESLCRQEMPPMEVIIADDGSTDGTLDWLDSLMDGAYPFTIRYITREHSWYRLASINNMERHSSWNREQN